MRLIKNWKEILFSAQRISNYPVLRFATNCIVGENESYARFKKQTRNTLRNGPVSDIHCWEMCETYATQYHGQDLSPTLKCYFSNLIVPIRDHCSRDLCEICKKNFLRAWESRLDSYYIVSPFGISLKKGLLAIFISKSSDIEIT